ncbi:A-kinase anchor protein 12-like [Phytophthora palmivora]|uniref:A-kinase anchor protein 12-like n=1 Tax=Phytophthora palmivora TaxID=4796 RepID=A0A2P4XL55_9STRA|nr:A-kinase anchor protein 12-like [Phytophthora palmivora]
MLGIGAVWKHFPTFCPPKRKTKFETDTCEEDSTISEDDSAVTGSEWLYIEEPVGFFMPKMQKRKQHLHLDQAQHLLHYANFKHVMRLHSISLVTPVEETDVNGVSKWWMTMQDPSTLQVWVVHFPSLHRLLAWIDLLTSVFKATNSRAIVSDLVFIGAHQTVSSS